MEKSEMTLQMAHEVKNALTSIHGYAELISYGIITGEELCEKGNKIKEQAKKIERLVNDVVNISLLDECKKDNESFKDIVYSAIKSLKEGVLGEEVSKAEINISDDVLIYCNREQFVNMIKHLLENAIIYNESKIKKIDFLTDSDKEKTLIVVRDNGIGVRGEDSEKIFECFFRVNKNLSREHGGNGLGLYLCKKICEAHNGEICAKSHKDGTEICMILKTKKKELY